MEIMFSKASKILAWIGWFFLGAVLTSMAFFGFYGSMVSLTWIVLENGGDPTPILYIVKGVGFMFQFAFIMFIFASLMWALSLLTKERKKRWEEGKQKYFEEMKEKILEAMEEAPEFKLRKSRRRK